ncbi:hypothetical protein RI129_001001 [Pyrocoelia pectoralis]|uniref:Ubiquitin-like protease family profile domain-containing protein n=1 Tax=Pyrocoelia pectoralis TaxID=417401 RepID=A0AAN7ZPD2_9COLE
MNDDDDDYLDINACSVLEGVSKESSENDISKGILDYKNFENTLRHVPHSSPIDLVEVNPPNNAPFVCDPQAEAVIPYYKISNNFDHYLSSFPIQFSSEGFHKEFYRTQLKNLLVTKQIFCVLSFRGIHFRQNNYVDYAVCKYNGCRKFKFISYFTKGSSLQTKVYSTSSSINHSGNPKFYHLKGQERKELKKLLIHQHPRSLQCDLIKNLNEKAASNGNFQDVRKLNVFQKARSESIADNDLSKNDFTDLTLKYEQHTLKGDHQYIQSVALPLHVCLFSKRQLQILSQNGKSTLHFDATGSLVRDLNFNRQGKRIFYYAGVIQVNGTILPMLELITNAHGTESITSFLTNWASINSIINSFNQMSVSNYLNLVYNYLIENNMTSMNGVVRINICCAHFMHIIVRRVKSMNVGKKVGAVILDGVGQLVMCSSMNEIRDCFIQLMIVLLYPYETIDVHKAITKLANGNYENIVSGTYSVGDDAELEDVNTCQNLNSQEQLFFTYFKNIYNKVQLHAQNSEHRKNPSNTFYLPTFATILLEKYMPYVALWSGLLLEPGIKRHSNAVVENWFKQVKHYVTENKGKDKIGRFITKLEDRITAICIESKYIRNKNKIVKKLTKSKTLVTSHNSGSTNTLVEERWGKRPAPENKTHFESRVFKKIKLEKPFVNVPTVVPSNSHANLNTMANSLYNIPTYYYTQLQNEHYVVGIYHHPVGLGSLDIKLYGDEYSSLFNQSWLHGTTIDACILSKFKEINCNSILYIPTGQSLVIMEHYKNPVHDSFVINKLRLIDVTKLLIPYNVHRNHWIVLIVDIINSKFIIYDSGKTTNTSAANTYRKHLSLYLKDINRKYGGDNFYCIDNFSTEIISFPCQTDGYNCGIFAINFMLHALEGTKLEQFAPNDFRNYLQTWLLSTSDCMRNTCLICGLGEDANGRELSWIQCSSCLRWIHFKCLPQEYKTFHNRLANDSFTFSCLLCERGNV